jgi:diphthamide biosynthesis enzyme Dph1/Dph2-like protein
MGGITYGACYIDGYTARALNYDLLVPYSHDCLIPAKVTKTKILYVFVDIGINASTSSRVPGAELFQRQSVLHPGQESRRSGPSLMAVAIGHPRSR